jgi:hypothetical protein
MNHDENLTYEWLRNLRNKLIKEEKVRDFVSGNIAKTAQAVGALDINFTHGAGDDITLDPNWVQQNITTVTLHDGQKIQFNKNYAELLVNAFRNACEASRIAGKPFCPKNNGAFNTRTLRGKEKISNHAFGTAIDFLTAGTQTQITNYPEFINTMKQSGFIWGGDWKPEYYDPMHFEVNVGGAVPTGVGGGAQNIAGGAGGFSGFSDWKTHAISGLRAMGIPDNPLNITESEDKLINPKDKFKLKDKTKDQKLEKNKKVLLDMLSFYDKKLKFEKPVLIKFIDDEENAGKILGKTAFYDPDKTSITIFTTNRLLKDILRSLGHELIHHKQHCKDEFHDVQTFEGYAQKDKKLRRKEKEAYLFGNMLFRDWEDNYKSNHKETK